MKYLLILLFIFLAYNCSSQNVCFRVDYNGETIERRYYAKDTLYSMVLFNCTDSKDSITYDYDKIVWNHYLNGKFIMNDSFPFHKYYHPYFDKSLCYNEIYSLINSHKLIEDVLWSLAVIDDEITNDSTNLASRNIFKLSKTNYCIMYKNINSQCALSGVFKLYNEDVLRSLTIYIRKNFLVKMIFEGEKTNQMVLFKYRKGILSKKNVYISSNRNRKKYKLYENYRYYYFNPYVNRI